METTGSFWAGVLICAVARAHVSAYESVVLSTFLGLQLWQSISIRGRLEVDVGFDICRNPRVALPHNLGITPSRDFVRFLHESRPLSFPRGTTRSPATNSMIATMLL